MLDGYGSRQSTVQPQQLVWENVAINSILAINNLTQPNSTNLPQLIRIPILIFDIRTNGLIDTGAAASLVSSDILFKLRGKTVKSLKNEENAPIFRTVSGQELHSLGKYEFPVTINKDHTFLHSFYVMNNLKENCILGIDFLSQNNVKINTKNKQLNYDHAAAEQILETDCPVYSLTIGDDQTEIPLTAYDRPYNIIRRREVEIPDELVTTESTYQNPAVFNQMSPNHKHVAIIPDTYEERPITANDLLDLLPFQQFIINDEEELVSTVPVSEFNLSHLEPDKRRIVFQQLYEFEKMDLFSNKEGDLGLAIDVKHFINTGDNPPVSMRSRRTPEALKSKVWEQLRSMLAKNVIRNSSSPYAAGIVMALKKDGTLRLCIDYRLLNKITIKDKFPLPRIDDTIDALYGARYFSTLDLLSGYWQIEINEADKHKTAFICELGLFEFNRMPFGLTNAPGTFQRAMNDIFKNELYKFVLVYLDDIIIYSKTFDDHIVHLRSVFELLLSAGLRLNRTKCEFFKNEIDYLGYIVSIDGIAPNTKKMESITSYPEPTNQKELASFLGLASYYRKFVRAFAEKAHPLTALTKKSAQWKWGPEERDAFNCIKQCLTTKPILGYPDFTREFIIYTDASGYGIGAVLAQMQAPALPDTSDSAETGDREVVIAYTSKHLSEREAKWSTTEKECYAIIHAIEVFRPYLYGRSFTVFTDHRPLEWLMSKPEPAGRLQRWALKIQEYDMKIGYRPGKSHQNADCLSRIPKNLGAIPKTPNKGGVIAAVMFTPRKESQAATGSVHVNTADANISEWAKLQQNDEYCQMLIKRIEAEIKQEAKRQARYKEQLQLEKDYRHLFATRKNKEPSENIYEADKEVKSLRHKIDGPNAENELKTKRYNFNEKGEIIDINNRLIVPRVKVKDVLIENHDHMLAGHLGIAKTIARIKRHYIWKGLKKDVVVHVTSCILCARRKAIGTTKAPLQPLPPVYEIWERIAMDIVGPVRESRKGYRYILVISDYASRFVITIPMKDQKAQTVAKHLVHKVITKYGAPQNVLTDRGTNFLSHLVKEICILFKIKQMRTTAYHPQTDGLVERFNRTLVDMLTCYVVDEPEQWERFLPYVTFAYNTAVHTTLQECPFFLFFGRPPVLPNDIKLNFKYEITGNDALMYTKKWMQAQRLARLHLFKAQEKQKFHYNLGTIETKFEVGDWVLLKTPPMAGKFINRWDGPFQITKNYSKVNYEIENVKDKKQKRMIVHVNRIKKFNQREHDYTSPSQLNQQHQIVNADTRRAENKQNNTDPPHPIKRGRGRPRKNIAQTNEPTLKQNQNTPSLLTQHQNDQSTKQQGQRVGFGHNKQNQPQRINKSFTPHWRGRLRSSPNIHHDFRHSCHCPRCLSLRSEQVTENYQPPQSMNPETTRREIPFQKRYNLRSRH